MGWSVNSNVIARAVAKSNSAGNPMIETKFAPKRRVTRWYGLVGQFQRAAAKSNSAGNSMIEIKFGARPPADRSKLQAQ